MKKNRVLGVRSHARGADLLRIGHHPRFTSEPARSPGPRSRGRLRAAQPCYPLLPLHEYAAVRRKDMCEFQFYLERPDGVAPTLDYRQFPSESAAVTHARGLLNAHASAVRVRIWRGDKPLLVVARAPGDPDPDPRFA